MGSDVHPEDESGNHSKFGKKILVVDDRYENRYFLKTLLSAHGYQVVTAKNGKEALDLIKSEHFDAILTDILMPVMDGHVLCKTMKEDPELAKIPFIFNTASYTEPRHRQHGLSLGADEYICKPIESEELLRIIERFV